MNTLLSGLSLRSVLKIILEPLELTYFVDLEESDRLSGLLEELNGTFPGIGVSFIDPNQMPSV